MNWRFCTITLLLSMTQQPLWGQPATNDAISFREQIRPILSANCFKCHGPDANTREAELRLDQFDVAIADRGGYAVLVPGDAKRSVFYQRVVSHDDAERMPPPESNRTLSEEQKELIRRWIDQGAQYEKHWAFEQPQSPPLPTVRDVAWPKNDIDRFILAELERNGLQPSPQADKYQLVRRLYLDLIGLPPTIEEADQFVLDSRSDAYERLVDKLLASPRYGERWARRWLDLARYSDTNGYEKDRPRSMWLYRDWVIQAINNDMSFTDFTIEQLAGDMLPEATQSQRIATGFHRNTMVNEEGGVDPQEFRFNSIVDRVATTGTAWLGLTLGCAQCHTHKYDPITHTEYYGVFALFNNADEVDEHVSPPEIVEKQKAIEREIAAQLASLPDNFPIANGTENTGAASAERAAAQRRSAFEAAYGQWQKQAKTELSQWKIVKPEKVQANLATMTVLEDGSVLASGDVTKNDIYELEFSPGEATIAAIRLEALLDDSLPNGGPGRQSIEVVNASSEGDFFLSELFGKVVGVSDADDSGAEKIEFSDATATYTTPGLTPAAAFDRRSDTGWRVMGRVGEVHAAVFVLKSPITVSGDQRLKLRLEHESFYPAGLGRFRVSFAADNANPPIALYPDKVSAVLHTPETERTLTAAQILKDYFLLHTPELADAQAEIAKLRAQIQKPINALVMRERQLHPRVTRRHQRGEFLKPQEEVSAGVPEVLPPLPAGAPKDRLTFARWLVDRNNPLTARVFVNRQWQAFFHQGIVRTLEDFGVQGEFPTHPQLLDYLAVEFMRRGWSMKQLHKLIVTSATYQQSDEVTADLLARDPENKLLARSTRFRVEAEIVRDVLLRTGGLLHPAIGGPSVFPDQPPGITEAAYGPLEWKVSTGKDRFRRGLYTFNKRTAPYAAFGLFDAPSGEACIARRSYSNTPLQALAVLNDSVTLEAARSLAAESMHSSDDDPRSVATTMFRRSVTRPPSTGELDSLCQFYEHQFSMLEQAPVDAVAIIRGGDAQYEIPADLLPQKLAAWMLTARAILNLEETLARP